MLRGALRILIALVLMCSTAASGQLDPNNAGYDYTRDLLRDCEHKGMDQHSMFGQSICEIVEPEPLTMAEALRRGLEYRAVSWGKRFPANEDGWFLAKSGEFIPQSWALVSSDGKFHRCTYDLNNYWSGVDWKVRPNNSTLDGKPPTKCFWRPSH